MTKHFLIRREFIKKAKISEKVLKEWELSGSVAVLPLSRHFSGLHCHDEGA